MVALKNSPEVTRWAKSDNVLSERADGQILCRHGTGRWQHYTNLKRPVKWYIGLGGAGWFCVAGQQHVQATLDHALEVSAREAIIS